MDEKNLEVAVVPILYSRCEQDSKLLFAELGMHWVPVAIRAGEDGAMFGGVSILSNKDAGVGKITVGVEGNNTMRLIVEEITPATSVVLLIASCPRTDARDLIDAVLSEAKPDDKMGLVIDSKGDIAMARARAFLSAVRVSG